MRSGWPHTGDGRGMTPANQGHVPFGPEVSWPTGYSDPEYSNGDYRYPQTRVEQLPDLGQGGAHPYAASGGAGYGDDGYSDPGYQGPVAQDAGIAGTRTVRGFVESGQGQADYRDAGYAGSSYMPPAGGTGYSQPGYAGSSYAAPGEIDMAYPPSAAASAPHGADLYSQPWDYGQPLRYDGEEDTYLALEGHHQPAGDYGTGTGAYGSQRDDGAVRYEPPAFDPAAYNGSDYSMPGINGPGYDLSGIIGTNDFEAIGYDEPGYGRLSYDDPRYDDSPRQPRPGQRFNETRTDLRRFDETRLDSRWLPGEDVRREADPAPHGNDGFTDSRSRSGSAAADFDRGRGARSARTRYDMKALVEPGDSTRFDVPAFDETRLDNLRAFTPARGLRRSGALLLAPPAKPRSWAEDTSLDQFADLDLTDVPVPAAFTRTLDRPDERALELPPHQDDDTASRRAIGKRRGRSGDRRQWMALGAIAVVAAGAIGGVFMKYVFAGPSGPAHQVVAPQAVDGFTRSANLEKQLNVAGEATKVAKASGGQASDVVYGVYQMGSLTPGTDAANTQMFMFVGGKLAGADPSASVANFEQTYAGSTAVSPGALGGEAACTETHLNGQSASMCVWFDNDTFGTVVSPTMTTAKLASTMDAVRPSLELPAK
jgi:hypothetical protein